MSIETEIKKNLDFAIQLAVEKSSDFVKNPLKDFTRNRKLNMQKLIEFILSMKGNSLNKELYEYYKTSGMELTASAFVQQRDKLLYSAFEYIFKEFNTKSCDKKNYRGYQLYAVDGTDINIARNEKSETYIKPCKGNSAGYNQIHLNAMYDLLNRVYVDCIMQPRPKIDERGALNDMIHSFKSSKKTIMICDRGYESYNTIAHFMESPNADYLIRVRNGVSGIKEIRESEMKEYDQDFSITITTTATKEDKNNNYRKINTRRKEGVQKNGKPYSSKTNDTKWDFTSPYVLKFRAVRFLLQTGEYETIITSLPRSEFSINDINELYHKRWGIETSFRDLKYAIGLVNNHAKKEESIKQEIFAGLIMYNFCERITGAVVVEQKKGNAHTYQVNCVMAIHICTDYFAKRLISTDSVTVLILKYTLPVRPGRQDKRKMKSKSAVSFLYRVAA